MHFEIGFAGIPREFIDFVYRQRASFCGPDVTYVSETLKPKSGYYADAHARFFAKHFERRLREDHNNHLADTGFAVLYVATHPEALDFAEALFPAVLTVPVQWTPAGHNQTTRGRSARELTQLFREGVDGIRRSIPLLKKELTEQVNRTPWLLPRHNFHSKLLVPKLMEIQRAVADGVPIPEALESAKRDFVREHAFRRVGDAQRACFTDRRDVQFHPPGKARHAFARPIPGQHPPMCLVAGRRRLGSPYDRVFHYDCARGNRITGQFATCHEPPARMQGDPHLNVAPNDFVRG